MAGSKFVAVVGLLLAGFLTFSTAQKDSCQNKFPPPANRPPPPMKVHASLELWQGVVFIVGFGMFAVLMSLIFRLIRKYAYYDGHLMDTFFDAGGNHLGAFVSCAIVTRWLWTSAYTKSTTAVFMSGLAGHFWYSAAGCIQLLLFAIAASEFRIKAPGAKTFLQVIHCRFGKVAHILTVIIVLLLNGIVSGMIMMEGTRILTSLTMDINKEVICIILTLAAGVYVIVGGLGGGLYMAYFASACIVSLTLTYFFHTFYNPLDEPGQLFDDPVTKKVCEAVSCAKVPSMADNQDDSALTFYSESGVLEAVTIVFAGFSTVFVDQSFWHGAVAARPSCAKWAFLLAGLAYFAIPFMLSFTFGMSYWALRVQTGHGLVNEMQARDGYILPVIMSQQLMGRAGDFMMYALTLAVVITAVSSEVLSMSSIFMYDVYQTYINPFVSSAQNQTSKPEAQRQDMERFTKYNRRSVIIMYLVTAVFVLLVFPITLVLMVIDIDLSWLFKFIGILCGSFAIPILLAVTWHRTTRVGYILGVICGLAAAFIGWLVYASQYDGGLTEFRHNTGRQVVFITGQALALGVSGIICLLFSLTCGGCDPNLHEEDEWEKCRKLDNPLMPWAVRYATDFCNVNRRTGRPHFYQVRRSYRDGEISAYVLGVLLSVCILIVWPALMLLAGSFNCDVFFGWSIAVAVLGVIAAAFLGLVSPLYELVEICRQAARNRSCDHKRLEEDDTSSVTTPAPAPTLQTRSVPRAEVLTDAHITGIPVSPPTCKDCTYARPASVIADVRGDGGQKWKTFIKLD